MADTVMEHLPHSGWGDVARVSDLSHIHSRFDYVQTQFDGINRQFDEVDRRFEEVREQLRGIKGALWLMVGSMVTVATGIIVLLIQLNQNISNISGP